MKIFFSLLMFLILSFSTTHAHEKQLQVIALTDLHGSLESEIFKTKEKLPVEIGGAALLARYIEIAKFKSKTPTIILDAGDLFQGSLVSNTADGKPTVDFYKALGVNAVAIGNHEFDFGPGKLLSKDPNEIDLQGALKARIEQAKGSFKFLAANIRYKKDGKIPEWISTSDLIAKDDVTVGVIGIATVKTPETTFAKYVADLDFLDPIEPVLQEVQKLKQKAMKLKRDLDFIILIAHAGGGCKDNSVDKVNDLSTCEANSELIDILNRLPPQTVDLAIGGHTHKGVFKIYQSTPVIQAFSKSKYMGVITLSTHKNHKFDGLIPICGSVVPTPRGPSCFKSDIENSNLKPIAATYLEENIFPQPEIVKLLEPEFKRVEEIKNTKLNVEAKDTFNYEYYNENPLGNLLVDILDQYFKSTLYHGHDFENNHNLRPLVLLNNGGIRHSLNATPNITYGDIFEILFFDNRLATITVDSETLIKMIEIGISRKHGGISWSNLSFTAENCKVLQAHYKNEPIDPKDKTKIFKILTVDFVATGGVGFRDLGLKSEQIEILDHLPIHRDVVVEALKKYGKSLEVKDFFNPEKLRQKILKPCQ